MKAKFHSKIKKTFKTFRKCIHWKFSDMCKPGKSDHNGNENKSLAVKRKTHLTLLPTGGDFYPTSP